MEGPDRYLKVANAFSCFLDLKMFSQELSEGRKETGLNYFLC